jgi:ligand-binding sensor domain-containing protein
MRFCFFVRKCRVICFLYLLQIYSLPCFSQSSIYRQYELSSIYQPITANKITQDPYGRLWIGTTKGLFGFDGSEFTLRNFRNGSSLNVTAVFCDSNYAWIGFEDGKIARMSLRNWTNEIATVMTLDATVTRIVVDQAQQTWISTYGKGLFVKNKDGLINISQAEGLPSDEIYAMALGKDGVVWLGTDAGLTRCIMQRGRPLLKTFTVSDGLSDEIVRSLTIDDQGKIWIGTEDQGLCQFDPVSNQFTIPPFSRNWTHGPVTALAIQNTSRLMIGTFGNGLLSISLKDNFRPNIYDASNGYDNVKVSDILEDAEGNFWVVSSSRGLDQFPALFEWMTLNGQQIKGSVEAVLYASDSYLWFATTEGLFRTLLDSTENHPIEKIKLHNGKKEPVVTSIYEDQKNNIWICSFDSGIFLIPKDKKAILKIREKAGLANDNVLSVNGDANNVWIATLGGVTRCNIQNDLGGQEDLILENFTEESGLNSNFIYQTFIDSRGRVWFATDGNGLKVLENNKFTTYDSIDSIQIHTVYSIAEDLDGNIWFTTPSNGIFEFDGKKFKNYGLAAGISDLSINGIAADANGDIVILANDAIDVLERHTGQVRRYRGKPLFDDISPNLNAYCSDRYGNIWIATKKGILKYYSPSPLFWHQARLQIRQVMVYLEPVDFGSVNSFNYNQNHFTFDFQAYWYSNPAQIRYRYMLEGHDLDWIVSKDERASYPELPSGTYTFKIQSTIHHNFNDAPIQFYKFFIKPPIWTTWWFILGCSILGALVIYSLIKRRDKWREREGKLKRDRIEFQLENLKSQINPHFLFNSFNTLATLVEEDQKIALSYIDHLADFYRSLLAYKDIDLVTLKKELELTRNYVFLLKQRHGERLVVHTNIPEYQKERMIPPLTLQLLIENAVKHNVVSKDHPLTIEIFIEGENRLCVKNNLQRKNDVDSTRFGLQNIRARCELLGRGDFEVKEAAGYFIVYIPLFDARNSD